MLKDSISIFPNIGIHKENWSITKKPTICQLSDLSLEHFCLMDIVLYICYLIWWHMTLISHNQVNTMAPGQPSSLHWRHKEHDGVSNHLCLDCLLNSLFRCRSKKTPNLCVTGFVRGIHLWPVDSPHKGPVTWKMFPFALWVNSVPLWCTTQSVPQRFLDVR